jgi:hypothetical protein
MFFYLVGIRHGPIDHLRIRIQQPARLCPQGTAHRTLMSTARNDRELCPALMSPAALVTTNTAANTPMPYIHHPSAHSMHIGVMLGSLLPSSRGPRAHRPGDNPTTGWPAVSGPAMTAAAATDARLPAVRSPRFARGHYCTPTLQAAVRGRQANVHAASGHPARGRQKQAAACGRWTGRHHREDI